MKLLLPIGPPKTGSTSIQKSLAENSETLREAGFVCLEVTCSPKTGPF